MNGIELTREYFFTIAAPLLKREFPGEYSRLAAGLAGNGSECFGYDDEISRDHDWGVDFYIWVPEADREAIPALTRWKSRLFEEAPPPFQGKRSEYGKRVGVMTAGDFYKELIGFPGGPESLREWYRVPEENLAMSVNGQVFVDGAGEFSSTRRRLRGYFPEDLRRKRISARCMALAQTGQYNHMRMAERKDWVTVRSVMSLFHSSAVAMTFLLNRTYRPYYKWAFRMMRDLPILGSEIASHLEKLALAGSFDKNGLEGQQEEISAVCSAIVAELRRQNLSFSEDWFLTVHGEEIRNGIEDDFLRSLPAQTVI